MKPLLQLLVIVCLMPPVALASDWPHLRGPAADGRVAAPGTFETGAVGLDLVWRIPLGSAYSGVAVAGGRAVTLFSDATSDWIAAFDATSGKEVWRHRMGDVTKGHDGSDDGPLSSPVVGGETVYALSPAGRLVALRMSDGEVVWTKQLDKDFGAKAPDFGFGTTPLFEGGVLIVQAGGSDGRTFVGLDGKTGEIVWSHGDDQVAYQSPTLMELAEKRQVVAVSAHKITGLAPKSGETLWVHELGGEDRAFSATPTFIGDDRFLILMSGGAAVFRVSQTDGTFAVEELYRSEALGRTYSPPVYHDGHVYGFRGQVLTCMNAAGGERVWRSRPPGGDGLILVDGHLVIFGAKGNVVVAEASPEGYNELARLQALGGSGLTWPSFASGRVYVRNLDEMAAVAVTRSRSAPTVTAAAPADHAFGRWVRSVEQAEDRLAKIESFLGAHTSVPIVEGEYVHFIYRGEANDVAIAGSMNESDAPEPMQRIEGTDLFHRSYRLEPGVRWEYRFQVDFDSWKTDPNNPRTVPSAEGEHELSELVTSGYTLANHTAEPAGTHGRLDEFSLKSEVLGYEKKIQVWLPPGYDDAERSYPLLVVNDGRAWLEKGLMANSLDNLVGKSVEPLVVAFVEPHGQWWLEAGGSRTDDYVRMQVEELMPALAERYRLDAAPTSRAVMGNLFYGVSTVYAALKHPDVFGKAALQSVFTGLGAGDAVREMIGGEGVESVTFYLDWNRYDVRNVDRDYDVAADSKELAGLLRDGGYTVHGGEVLDSYGWGGWRNRTDRLLTALFPIK